MFNKLSKLDYTYIILFIVSFIILYYSMVTAV
ncbi:hypothetical protein SAMN05421677_14212 [Halobacillus aidingensis]|uniref:Uncharacterized protein n=1 Tax=Halobacillus aidingensis TaxID=240303 RepID=A0A1H0VT68_HALAD|nr:hypothetical protein SAMN05421677_14212 [Halobacillus aidingensis]